MNPEVYKISDKGLVSLTCGLCGSLILWSRSAVQVPKTIKISYWRKVEIPVATGDLGASGYLENVQYVGNQIKWVKAIKKVDCCDTCYKPFLLKTDPIIER
jgi:hypothetical protein